MNRRGVRIGEVVFWGLGVNKFFWGEIKFVWGKQEISLGPFHKWQVKKLFGD